RGWGQARRFPTWLSPPTPLLYLRRQFVRVGTGPRQQLPQWLPASDRPQQVLGVEIRAAELRRLAGGLAEQLAGVLAPDPGQIDPPHRLAGDSTEEPGEELLERIRLERSATPVRGHNALPRSACPSGGAYPGGSRAKRPASRSGSTVGPGVAGVGHFSSQFAP